MNSRAVSGALPSPPWWLGDPGAGIARAAHATAALIHRDPAQLAAAAAGAYTGAATAACRIRALRRRAAADGARVIEIKLPPEVEPGGATLFWSNLLGLHRPRLARLLRGQPHVALEYVFTATTSAIRLWVPGTIPAGLVEHAIEAAWPGARADVLPLPISPLTPVGPGGANVGGRLVPGRSHTLPLRTKHDIDPLRALLAAGAHLRGQQSACVQVLVRPAGARQCATARRSLRAMQGKSTATLKSVVFDTVTVGTRTHRVNTSLVMDHRLEADARAAAAKLAGPLFEAEILYAATVPTSTSERAETHQGTDPAAHAAARGICHEIASTMAVHAERNYLRRRRLDRPGRRIGQRCFTRGALYSIPELAALAHLPWDPNAPGFTYALAKPVPPNPAIPDGTDPDSAVKILGDADAGPGRQIGLTVPDARHHTHVIGATGSGKSTLLINLLLQDVAAGRGAVVIDPQGDLVADILDRLPLSALTRPLYLFDPCEADAPVPRLNILDPAGADLAVDHLVSIFKKIYSAYWGPRSDDLVRACGLTLLAAKQAKPSLPVPTLASVPAILASDQERRRYTDALERGTHTVLFGFWDWYTQLSEPARAQITAPLMNKVRAFLMRDYPARILGGATNLDLSGVLDGGLLLARLPKGVLGEETTRLLGSLLLAATWQSATGRSARATRPDAALYVDEAHDFLNLAVGVETMLAQARALRVGLTLAHQNLAQLPAEMREAVSANARTKIYFNAAPEDARNLARHTMPALGERDLSRLGAYQVAARLVVNAAAQPACTLTTRPLPPVIPGRAAQARAHAAHTLTGKAP